MTQPTLREIRENFVLFRDELTAYFGKTYEALEPLRESAYGLDPDLFWTPLPEAMVRAEKAVEALRLAPAADASVQGA